MQQSQSPCPHECKFVDRNSTKQQFCPHLSPSIDRAKQHNSIAPSLITDIHNRQTDVCRCASIEEFNTLTNDVNCLNKENKLLNTLIDIYTKKSVEDISAINHNISTIRETINTSNTATHELELYIKHCSKDNKKSYMKHIDAVEIRMIDEIDSIKQMMADMKTQLDKQIIDISNQLKTINQNYSDFINDINKLIESPEEDIITNKTMPIIATKKTLWSTILCREDNSA